MADFRILQLTDLHLFRDPGTTLFGIPTQATLRTVVETILSHEPEFDRIVITGDHTHDELPETYRIVREILKPWLDRLCIVPGNHDDRSVMRAVLGDVIQRQCRQSMSDEDRIHFSVSAGDWKLLGIDTHFPGEVAGQVGHRQLDWLRSELEQHADGPAIIFCHHPPAEIGCIWMDRIGIIDRVDFVALLNEQPNVRMVCCGHVHHEFEGQLRYARVVASPSTGIQFHPAGSEATFADEAPGYRVLELTADTVTTGVQRVPAAHHQPQPKAL